MQTQKLLFQLTNSGVGCWRREVAQDRFPARCRRSIEPETSYEFRLAGLESRKKHWVQI